MTRARRAPLVLAGALVAVYVAAWALSPLVMRGKTDLDYFFWPVAQSAAHGHVLSAYSLHAADAYPDANGPLSLVLLAPLAALANVVGWTDPRVISGMVAVLAAVLALLLSREALRVVRSVRGAVEWPLAGHAAYLLAPVLWIAVVGFGHIEQLVEAYLVMLSARMLLEKRGAPGGAAFGLAVLARTAVLACAAPLALAAWARGRRCAAMAAGSAVAVGLAVMAPFLIADGPDVVHSLVGYRGGLPIGGGSVWVMLYRSPLATLVEHADSIIILAAAGVLCLTIARWRPGVVSGATGLYGLLTIAACCFPMLAKTVHSYYLLEPYVFGTTWWLARPGRALNWRIAVPALLTVDVFLAEWSVTLPLTGLGLVEGVLSSATLAAVIALVATDLLRQGRYVRSSTRFALTSSRMVTASTPTNTSPTRRGNQVIP